MTATVTGVAPFLAPATKQRFKGRGTRDDIVSLEEVTRMSREERLGLSPRVVEALCLETVRGAGAEYTWVGTTQQREAEIFTAPLEVPGTNVTRFRR